METHKMLITVFAEEVGLIVGVFYLCNLFLFMCHQNYEK